MTTDKTREDVINKDMDLLEEAYDAENCFFDEDEYHWANGNVGVRRGTK